MSWASKCMSILLVVAVLILIGGKDWAYKILPKRLVDKTRKNAKFLPIVAMWYMVIMYPLPASANIASELSASETAIGFSGKNMYAMAQFANLIKTVHDNCPADAIAKAEAFYKRVEQKYEEKYDAMSDADVLYNTWFLYGQLGQAHTKLIKVSDTDLCIAKYIMYNIQYWLRNRHIKMLQETRIIEDMDSYDPTELRGYKIKLEYLDRLIQLYQKYDKLLAEDIIFRVANPEVYTSIGGEQRMLADRTKTLMQLIVKKVMYDLKKNYVLTDKDIAVLKDRIILSYQPGCEKFFGRYQVTVVYNEKWSIIDKRMDNLQLKVNMCSNFFIMKEFPFYFQKIVTHELAHHIYYFVDQDTDTFEEVCWLKDDKSNGKCSPSDFVSEYAMTLATEDYAETFMHRFLRLVDHSTPRLEKKVNHFRSLFPATRPLNQSLQYGQPIP